MLRKVAGCDSRVSTRCTRRAYDVDRLQNRYATNRLEGDEETGMQHGQNSQDGRGGKWEVSGRAKGSS